MVYQGFEGWREKLGFFAGIGVSPPARRESWELASTKPHGKLNLTAESK